MRSPGALIAAGVAVVMALAFGSSSGAAAQAPSGPSGTTSGTVTSNGIEYPYLLHTLASYRPDAPAPLVVVVHGCQTTAQQELELSEFDDLAEREGFLVLYPEVDALSTQVPGPLNNCWRFADPTTYFRGTGDAAAIVAMTREVQQDRAVDDERVYLVGVSAGGLLSAALAATYPDLYAAVALVVSAGYADGTCFTTGTGTPVEASALLAHTQMGANARVVPAIGIGSDADAAFPASCTTKAVEQSLRTNNLVLGGSQESPLSLDPTEVREEQVPGGRASTVATFRDPDGCVVAERWIIHGMPHAWPGGAEYGGYTDTSAPDGAETTWAFLRRFERSSTSPPCAEAIASPSPTSGSPSTTSPLAPLATRQETTGAAPALPRTGPTAPMTAVASALALALAARALRGRRAASP